MQSNCVEEGGHVYCPTSFMNPVNFGSAWNKSLAFDLGAIVATETRARARCDSPHECGVGHVLSRILMQGTLVHDLLMISRPLDDYGRYTPLIDRHRIVES